MKSMIQKHPFASFLLLAFGITWAGSLIGLAATPRGGQLLPAFLSFPSAIIWYFGPCAAALVIISVTQGRPGLLRLVQRYRDWRVGWQWYALIVLYPLTMHLVVSGLNWLTGGPAPKFFEAEGVPAIGNIWLTLLGLALLHFFMRGLGEETGWRGFALPYLQQRWSAFTASLLLGFIWALWHFHPINFSALLSITGVFLFLNIMLTTVVFTWVYNHTRGSLLIAALFHMTLNVSEYIVPIGYISEDVRGHLLQIAVILLFIFGLLLRYGPNLKRETTAATLQMASIR
jgi:uncharacterized protein